MLNVTCDTIFEKYYEVLLLFSSQLRLFTVEFVGNENSQMSFHIFSNLFLCRLIFCN